MKHEYSDEEIKKVIGKNVLRVLKRIWVSDIFMSENKEQEYLKKYKVKVPWKLFLIMALVSIAIAIPAFSDTPVMSLGLTWRY